MAGRTRPGLWLLRLPRWMQRLWHWTLDGGPQVSALAYGALLALALTIQALPQFRYLDWKLYDLSMRLLRQVDQRPGAADVVVVGADEATFSAFDEPIALWHGRLGALIDAMADAKPRVLGFDVVLPAKSFEATVPGIDRQLMLPLLRTRDRLPLVIGQSVDDNFQPREIFAGFARMLPPDAVGSVVLCTDEDGVVRRTIPGLCGVGGDVPTLAERMAARLGAPPRGTGLIDYRVGAPLHAVSMVEVLRWHREGDVQRLRETFEGRAVLVGLVLPLEDRLQAPVPLFSDEPVNRRVPGVMLHAQILQSLLSEGYIKPLPPVFTLLLTAAACLLWFGLGWRKTLLYWTLLPLLAAVGVYGLWLGYTMSQASLLLAAQLAYSARRAVEYARHERRRELVEAAFAGHASPQLLEHVNLAAQAGAVLAPRTLPAAVLHVSTGPQAGAVPGGQGLLDLAPVLSSLQRAVERHGGMLDTLSGSQAVACFGVPLATGDAMRCALEAALQLKRELAEATAERVPLGVGIAWGEVQAGVVPVNHASPYLVWGACMEEAARLARQALAHADDSACPVLLSAEAAQRVGGHGLQPVEPENPQTVFRLSLE